MFEEPCLWSTEEIEVLAPSRYLLNILPYTEDLETEVAGSIMLITLIVTNYNVALPEFREFIFSIQHEYLLIGSTGKLCKSVKIATRLVYTAPVEKNHKPE